MKVLFSLVVGLHLIGTGSLGQHRQELRVCKLCGTGHTLGNYMCFPRLVQSIIFIKKWAFAALFFFFVRRMVIGNKRGINTAPSKPETLCVKSYGFYKKKEEASAVNAAKILVSEPIFSFNHSGSGEPSKKQT